MNEVNQQPSPFRGEGSEAILSRSTCEAYAHGSTGHPFNGMKIWSELHGDMQQPARAVTGVASCHEQLLMSQQRVPFGMRAAAKNRLADWWDERFDYGLINQLTGNTNQTDVRWTGNQSPVAPDAQHVVFANGKTSEGTLASGDIFTLNLIDQIVAKAHTLAVPIRPIKLKGMEIYGVLFLHPFQVQSLRQNFTSGQWGDIQKAALTGGQITGNPIFSGAIGIGQYVPELGN